MKFLIVSVLSLAIAVESCLVTFQNAPVCGSDGNTYINEVALNCAAVQRPELQKVKNGKCDVCRCLQVWGPICASNGVSYFSACQMVCKNDGNVQVVAGGFCNCNCKPCYSPVCGSDGKTYANQCVFDCYKTAFEVTKVSEGEC